MAVRMIKTYVFRGCIIPVWSGSKDTVLTDEIEFSMVNKAEAIFCLFI